MSEPDHSKDTKNPYLIEVWLVFNQLKHWGPHIVHETSEWRETDVKSHVGRTIFYEPICHNQ